MEWLLFYGYYESYFYKMIFLELLNCNENY